MNIRRLFPHVFVSVVLLVCGIVPIVGNSGVQAADTFQWDSFGPNKTWTAIQINDDGTKMVGVADFPYTSVDSGLTWSQQTVIAGNPWGLNGVALSGDGSRAVMVAGGATSPNGFAYLSTNAGVTWARGAANTGFQNISGSNNGQYLVAAARPCCVGANPGIFLSTDFGATFVQKSYLRFQKTAISNDGAYVLAAGPDGLYKSTDGGTNFSNVSVPGASSGWGGVAISGDGSKWFIAGGGLGLLMSIDQGTTWTVKVNDIALGDIDISTNGQSIIAGGNTKLAISLDGGATWDQQNAVRNYRAVSVSNDGSKFAAVESPGNIYVSSALPVTTTTAATTTSTAVTTTTIASSSTSISSTTTTALPSTTLVPVLPSSIGDSAVASPTNSVPPNRASSPTNAPLATAVSTTTSTTKAPAATLQTIAGESIARSPGEVSALINGESVDTELTRVNNYVIASAENVQMKLRLIESDGSQKRLDDEGNLRIEDDDSLEISLTGMGIGSVTSIHLFSNPVNLGEIKISSGKVAVGVFEVPEISDGDHRLVVNGVTSRGEAVTLVLGVSVGAKGESAPVRLFILMLLGLAVATAIAIPARRRSGKITL